METTFQTMYTLGKASEFAECRNDLNAQGPETKIINHKCFIYCEDNEIVYYNRKKLTISRPSMG